MKGRSVQRIRRKCKFAIASVYGVLLSSIFALNQAHAEIGSIVGEFVASGGAATYTVPIEVPPGTAGMQPELSLIYSSMSGAGLAGMGWSLSGFSSITRCGQTIFEDGAFKGIDYNNGDKFCLDGQRLVLISGTNGGNGAEYRTKFESFSRIKSYGTQGNGPAYFVVETKAGQKIEYGKTADSRILAQGRAEAFAWAQNKITDASNNYLDIKYNQTQANTEFYPSIIDYTGNTTTGSVPYASVEFVYRSRNDKPVSYLGGSRFQTTKQLDKIITKVGTQAAFEYRLAYTDRADSKPSLLKSIAQCAADGFCLPSTRFTWQESPASSYPGGAIWASGYPSQMKFTSGDINADGMMDLVSTGSATEKVYLSNGTSFQQLTTMSKCQDCKLADINGDGKADLVKAVKSGYLTSTKGNLQVALSNGNGFGAFTTLVANYPIYTTRDSEGFTIYNLFPFDVGDVNGDGKSDVVTVHTSGNLLYISSGSGFLPPTNSVACTLSTCKTGDFDGDGRTDLVKRGVLSKIDVALSTGSGFKGFATWAAPSVSDWDLLSIADANGDGLSDLISGTVFNSTGGSFENNGLPGCGTAPCGFADVNGDGQDDRVTTPGYVVVSITPNVEPDRIKKITSGMGSDLYIGYGKLNDAAVHTPPTNTGHPVYRVRSPLLLVTSLEQDNGIGGLSKTTYSYAGLKVNVHGLGSLGFASETSVNAQSGAKNVEEYLQNYPNIGFTKQSLSYQGNVLISKAIATPGLKVLNPGNRQFSFVSRSESIEYDPNSGSEIKRNITTNEGYDDYGNVGTVTSITKSPTTSEATPELKIVNTNVYVTPPDIANWHLGRLKDSTVVKTDNLGNQKRRTSSFAYNSLGLLQSEIVEPDSPESCTPENQAQCLKLRTTYEYDNFGNKIKNTVSGYKISPVRVSETHYDLKGRFPEWTKNAKLHRENYEFHPICGKKTKLTGPNGLETRWTYDRFCRQATETRADGTTTTLTREYTLPDGFVFSSTYNLDLTALFGVSIYKSNDLPNSLYRISTATTGAPTVYQYFDKLGRDVREETVGFDNKIIYQDTEYNSLGQIQRTSRRYFAGEPIFWVNYQYDAIGRVIKEDIPADNGGRAYTKTAYSGLTTTVTDAKNRVITSFKDVAGNVVRVDQPDGAYVINRYDPNGNLEETEDAYGNVTSMVYDDRGRKLSMDDPNMGHWEYRYSAADELIWQKDAKGQVVTMEYDVLGRMTKRTEPEGVVTTWTYDTQPYGKGKLASVSGPGGYSETATYDNKGRAKTATTNLSGDEYTITTDYDDATGRVSKVTRPGNFVVENVYDANGYLLAMRSPASQVTDYSKTHLNSLKTLAVSSASEALAKAQQYAADAAYYEQWADTYRNEVAQNAKVQYLTAEVAALQRHKSYKLYISQTSGDLYLESPDRVMILHGEIDTPIMIPPAAHYKVVAGANSEWTLQAVDLATWSSTVLPALAASGDHVFFGDYNADGKTDYIRNGQNEENPLYDSALLERLAGTAKEIQYVSGTLWSLADNALARASQLIAVAGQVDDRLRQTELWAENSDGQDLTAMGANNGAITYWQANTRDAEQRLTGFRQGNGLVTLKDYDPASGHLMGIQTGFEFGGNIRELEYHYDAMDNVTSRHDRVQGVTESFTYDNLDRLKKNSVSGSLNGIGYSYATDYQYDLTGNILYKSDVGSYTYGTASRANGKAGPSALRGAGSEHTNYQYDDNGNLLSGGGRVFQWTSDNKPKRLQKGTTWTSFAYGPDRARYLKQTSDGETTVYIGKLYEQIKQGTKTTHKHFIYAEGELAAIQIKTVDNGVTKPDQTRYMHTDNLGSVDTITDGFGVIVDRMGFDPFGMRRMGNWKKDLPLNLPVLTNRGFTGHEHVDDLGIIHMNGRIYDPELGRFLSADPNVQSPMNSQSHNRYSYVMNNPLKYTDPSGYFLKWLSKKLHRFARKWGRTLAIAIISYGSFGLGSALAGGSAIAGAAAAGFAGGLIATGTWQGALKGALIGAFSAGVAGWIGYGDDFANFSAAQKDVLHGLAQGVISEAAGGDFKSGFFGGWAGHAAGRFMEAKLTGGNPHLIAARTAVASVVGGVAAVLGGGKFENGAVSAAFAHLFNSELDKHSNTDESLGRNTAGWGAKTISWFKDIFGLSGVENPSLKMSVGGVAGKLGGAVTSAGISVLNTDMAGAGMILLERKWFSTCEAAGRCNLVEDYGRVPSAASDFSGAIEFYESRGHFNVIRNENNNIVDFYMNNY